MMRKSLNRFVAIAAITTLLASSLSVLANSNSKETLVDTSTPLDVAYTNEMIGNNYTIVSKKNATKMYVGNVIEIPVIDAYTGDSTRLTSDNYGYKNDALSLELGSEAKLIIHAPKEARYYLSFDYLSNNESILPIELMLSVNGEIPFYEARRLVFESTWVQKDEVS